MAESDDAYDSAEDSNHGGGGGEDEVMEVMEDDEEVTQATKKAKIKANSKKSTQVYNAKKKEAISTHLGNIRILFVMAHTEFMPINLFNQESGLGKIFKDTFDGDTKCQFDYLEVHEMVKFDKGDNREDLSSWWDDDWDTDELHTNGVTPFNFFELMEGEENHSVPATNHVLGCLFKHYMKETHQADVMVAFTKDSSVESAIQANGDRLAEFIGRNFDCVYLCDDSPFYHQAAHPKQAGNAFANTFYQFMAYNVSQKWWTSVYPPLKAIHLLANKDVRDAAIIEFKLPRATFIIPLDDSDYSDDDEEEGPWDRIYDKALAEIKNHPNTTNLPFHGSKKYMKKYGVVGKPVEGCAGFGVIFLKKSDGGVLEVKDIYGKKRVAVKRNPVSSSSV